MTKTGYTICSSLLLLPFLIESNRDDDDDDEDVRPLLVPTFAPCSMYRTWEGDTLLFVSYSIVAATATAAAIFIEERYQSRQGDIPHTHTHTHTHTTTVLVLVCVIVVLPN